MRNLIPRFALTESVVKQAASPTAGMAAIAGVLQRAQCHGARYDEWDDWLDGDEHADSDADDDD